VTPAEVVAAAEELMASGEVLDTPEGMRPAKPVTLTTARRAYLAGCWAQAVREHDPVEAGLALLEAGRPTEAVEMLVGPPLEGGGAQVVEAALTAGRRSGLLTAEQEGRLLLRRAGLRRAAGDSRSAAADLERAARRLRKSELVDVLGFAAAVADDLQRPQQAESLAALAAIPALEAGEMAKLGSVLTLQARSLSRIGFPREADRALEVGTDLVSRHGSDRQRYHARLNRAWVWLDRGDVRRAEPELDRLVADAPEIDPDSVPNQLIYLARALFAIGRPQEALARLDQAKTAAGPEPTPAVLFLSGLARVEGCWLYGRYLDGLAAVEELAGLLVAWENLVWLWRARLFAALGRTQDALTAADRAVEATPPGADGWRLRVRIRALQLELIDGPWPQDEAEDLTDLML
jgi:tetratricopeptide (TPR) repeat protein